MFRTSLLTAAAVIALMAPVHAEDTAITTTPAAPATTPVTTMELSFSQAMHGIKSWFGTSAKPVAAPVVETDTAAADDIIQIPPAPGMAAIEPAAGASDEDDLQVPPQYKGPKMASSYEDLAGVKPAAGEGSAPDMSKIDCKAILKAAESKEKGADLPDTALIEACEAPKDDEGNTAQPTFAPGTGAKQTLPETQPAAGEPPLGDAVMPGDKKK